MNLTTLTDTKKFIIYYHFRRFPKFSSGPYCFSISVITLRENCKKFQIRCFWCWRRSRLVIFLFYGSLYKFSDNKFSYGFWQYFVLASMCRINSLGWTNLFFKLLLMFSTWGVNAYSCWFKFRELHNFDES